MHTIKQDCPCLPPACMRRHPCLATDLEVKTVGSRDELPMWLTIMYVRLSVAGFSLCVANAEKDCSRGDTEGTAHLHRESAVSSAGSSMTFCGMLSSSSSMSSSASTSSKVCL